MIGIGTATFGGLYGKTFDLQKVVKKAIDYGFNYFDTSPYYNNSETVLGDILKDIPREKFILQTKVGRYPEINNIKNFDYSAIGIKNSVENSLQKLNTSYLDVLLLHDVEFIDIDTILSESIPTLINLKLKGKTKKIGFSCYPLETVYNLLQYPIIYNNVDVILVYGHNNLIDNTLSKLKNIIDKYNITLIDASPLALGLLTDNSPPSWHPAPKELKEICKSISSELKYNNKELSTIALKYSIKNSIGNRLLVGISNINELEKLKHSYDNYRDVLESDILQIKTKIKKFNNVDLS